MSTPIQVHEEGEIQLPQALREKYDLRSGVSLRIIDLDGVFVLVPQDLRVPELARKIEQYREEKGLSMKQGLEGPREERDRLFQGRYGNASE